MKIPVLNLAQFHGFPSMDEVYFNSFSDHMVLNHHLIDRAHSHDFFLCVLFMAGGGTHEIDFNSYRIGPGKVFFLKPGQTHHWKFETKPEGYIFFHSQAFYEMHFLGHTLTSFPFFYSYQNPPVVDLLAEELASVQDRFGEALSEYQGHGLLREMKLANLINAIYIELARAYTAHVDLEMIPSSKYTHLLEQLETLIDHHFHHQKFPKFYAEKLNVTPKHLNRVARSTLDKTTSELIAERIVLEAKRLLVHSQDQLAQIAYTLEFSDYAYFSRFFKTKTGMTPMAFRKQYTNG